MGRFGSFFASLLGAVGVMTAIPAQAEQMRVDGYFPAGSDEAAMLRTIAVDNFSGEDGPSLALLVADRLREVRIDGQPWLSVMAGRFGRDAEAVLGGNVRTRFGEENINLSRNVCVSYDDYNNCLQRADQNVPCLRVTVFVRPELRLTRRGGQLLWSFSQEASRNAEYCPDYDDRPDFETSVNDLLGDYARQVRYALAPAHESRSIRVLEGRGDLPRELRDPYRNAMRLVERDPAAACAQFASLAPQAPTHPQLLHNTALCAEREGRWDDAASGYTRLQAMRGARSEAQAGLNRLAQYRRARSQLERRGR